MSNSTTTGVCLYRTFLWWTYDLTHQTIRQVIVQHIGSDLSYRRFQVAGYRRCSNVSAVNWQTFAAGVKVEFIPDRRVLDTSTPHVKANTRHPPSPSDPSQRAGGDQLTARPQPPPSLLTTPGTQHLKPN